MCVGNYEEQAELCLMDAELQSIASQDLSMGFSFVNEGTAEKPKTGCARLVTLHARQRLIAGIAQLLPFHVLRISQPVPQHLCPLRCSIAGM